MCLTLAPCSKLPGSSPRTNCSRSPWLFRVQTPEMSAAAAYAARKLQLPNSMGLRPRLSAAAASRLDSNPWACSHSDDSEEGVHQKDRGGAEDPRPEAIVPQLSGQSPKPIPGLLPFSHANPEERQGPDGSQQGRRKRAQRFPVDPPAEQREPEDGDQQADGNPGEVPGMNGR